MEAPGFWVPRVKAAGEGAGTLNAGTLYATPSDPPLRVSIRITFFRPMLTTLKSGSTVHIAGLPVNVCQDVEVEVDETHLSNLSEEDANSLGIPCTRRHHHPPDIDSSYTPAGESHHQMPGHAGI
jgi:hypothetical protein